MPVAAAIPAAAGMVGGLLQQRAQNKQKKEEAALWNQYLQKYGQAQQQALGGLAAQGYNPFGPQTTTSTGTSTGTTFGESLSDIAPYITPEFAPLVGQVRGTLERRTAGPGATLPAGYVETGIRGINESYAPAEAGRVRRDLPHRLSGGAGARGRHRQIQGAGATHGAGAAKPGPPARHGDQRGLRQRPAWADHYARDHEHDGGADGDHASQHPVPARALDTTGADAGPADRNKRARVRAQRPW